MSKRVGASGNVVCKKSNHSVAEGQGGSWVSGNIMTTQFRVECLGGAGKRVFTWVTKVRIEGAGSSVV